MKKLLIVLIVLVGLCGTAGADTHNATSGSQLDVQTAVTAAADGDTVIVPAGNVTWSGYVTVDKGALSKGITIRGQGNTTAITDYGFRITEGTNKIRITGFSFIYNAYNVCFQICRNSSGGGIASTTGCRNIRIDNCKFTNYDTPMWFEGHNTGVVDHCYFYGACTTSGTPNGIEVRGYGDASWSSDNTWGSSDFMFFEDNYWYTQGRQQDTFIAGSNGARFVFRYNHMEETNSSGGHNGAVRCSSWIDTHNCLSPDIRATRAIEIYNNTFTRGTSDWARALDIRGGTALVFNNVFNITAGAFAYYVDILHYRSYGNGSNSCCSLDVFKCPAPPYSGGLTTRYCDTSQGGEGYPCQDQPGLGKNQASEPIYVWNNKDNNNTTNGVEMSCASTADFVRANRDYYESQKPGYTPYTYPHPLRVPEAPPKAPSLFVVSKTTTVP